jgi:hypothetical protein
MALRIRRGTDADRLLIAPLEGELIYTTDTKALYIGDGTTLGGIKMGPIEISDIELVNETTPTLGGNLNLNGYNIIGNGNINIDGTITATGNINLGDGNEDNINIGGLISSSIIPDADNQYDIGDPISTWRFGHFTEVFADNIETISLVTDRIVASDSTLVYDAVSSRLFANQLVGNVLGNVTGDLEGSVFGDDSSLLVDGVNGLLTAPLINNVKTSDNSETIIDVFGKEGYFKSITFDSSSGAEGVIGSLGNITLFTPSVTYLNLDNPDPNNPYIKINQIMDGPDAHAIVGVRARGNFISPAALQDGDEVISFAMAPFNGTSYGDAGSITGSVNYDGVDYTGKWSLSALSNAGIVETAVEITSETVEFVKPPKVPAFANESARDAAITNPSAGMLILLEGHDDSSGYPVFQGYDGTGWRDLY